MLVSLGGRKAAFDLTIGIPGIREANSTTPVPSNRIVESNRGFEAFEAIETLFAFREMAGNVPFVIPDIRSHQFTNTSVTYDDLSLDASQVLETRDSCKSRASRTRISSPTYTVTLTLKRARARARGSFATWQNCLEKLTIRLRWYAIAFM